MAWSPIFGTGPERLGRFCIWAFFGLAMLGVIIFAGIAAGPWFFALGIPFVPFWAYWYSKYVVRDE